MTLKISSICVALTVATWLPCVSQAQTVTSGPLNFETREQLQDQLRLAELKQQTGEAYLIRYRLEHGDFQDGDRIALRLTRGSASLSDTLQIREGKKLVLPQLGEISLDGVLRSELTGRIEQYLTKFLRDPDVHTAPLVRVGILGNVARPGFYYVPAELPISDVLMISGGPTPAADLDRTSVRRNGDVIIDEKNTRVALSNGMSLDLLHILAGDEISVGERRQTPWGIILPVSSAVIGLAISLANMRHR